MKNASLNICVQIFVWLQVLNCVNYIPGNRTAGSYGNFFSLNLRNSQTLFPERLNHFAFLPATQEGSNGIPLCSYIHFPNDPEHLFIYFLVTGLSFFVEISLQVFTYFSKLNCRSFCCLTSHFPQNLETKALPFLPVTFQWKGFQVLEKDTPGL